MNYIPEERLDVIFEFISTKYSHLEEVPSYEKEVGLEKLKGTLNQVKSDIYYPDIFSKATYLLLNINKGHFFSNGNKRLSLVVTTVFLGLNNFEFKNQDKDFYKNLLVGFFPEFKCVSDYEDFSPTDFVTYNLAIIVADSGAIKIEYDDLKERVKRFFENILEEEVKPFSKLFQILFASQE